MVETCPICEGSVHHSVRCPAAEGRLVCQKCCGGCPYMDKSMSLPRCMFRRVIEAVKEAAER